MGFILTKTNVENISWSVSRFKSRKKTRIIETNRFSTFGFAPEGQPCMSRHISHLHRSHVINDSYASTQGCGKSKCEHFIARLISEGKN